MSVVLHEVAHGWAASALGDPTARRRGRLTLNPLRHIDPVGTIAVPLVFHWLGLAPLGWARPVPVNFANLRHPRRDMSLVAAAGPLTNITLALLASLLLTVTGPVVQYGLAHLVVVNLLLAVFNLIPIPPLDGSRLILALLPVGWARRFQRIERWGVVVMIVLVNLGLLEWLWTGVEQLAGMLGVTTGMLV